MTMFVGVGTGNPLKFEAVRRVFLEQYAFQKIHFHSFDVPSGVENQPIGMETVVAGAVNRAKLALEELKKLAGEHQPNLPEEKIFGVGIEAGLVRVPRTITGFLDYQYCAIIDGCGQLALGSGPGWEYPPEVIRQISADRQLEIGTVMGTIAGNTNIKYQNGAIGFYTANRMTRGKITELAIHTALIPILNSQIYYAAEPSSE